MTDAADRPDDAASRRRVWDMIKDIRIALLVTRGPDGTLRSRPMAAQGDEFSDALWFFTQGESGKVDAIEADPNVLLVYAEPSEQHYVSISGVAEVVHDRDQVRSLWTEAMRVWFPDGPDAPEIALIRVKMTTAEYWDAPSTTMVYAYGYLKARLTGAPPHPGDHERVDM